MEIARSDWTKTIVIQFGRYARIRGIHKSVDIVVSLELTLRAYKYLSFIKAFIIDKVGQTNID